MYRLIIALLLGLTSGVAKAQEAQRGDLTIVVRDLNGAPLGGVTINLLYEQDDGARTPLGTYQTNQSGLVVLKHTAWGRYIVQFLSAPSGQRIQPVDQQNMGALDDTNGAGGGYGVYFADQFTRREMFVLGNGPEAIPYFDMASDPSQQPEPFNPQIEALLPPASTPQTLGQALAEHQQGRYQPSAANTLVLALLGLAVLAVALVATLGFVKSQRSRSAALADGEGE